MKKKKKTPYLIAVLILGMFCILLSACSQTTSVSAHNSSASATEASSEIQPASVEYDSEDAGSAVASDSYLHIIYNGTNYSYNSQVLTLLYAGVDSSENLTTYNRYSIAPRADTIELIVFDDYNKKISVLAISRDTITSVSRYTMNGNFRDQYDTHLGYAYTYGDGGQASCDNLIAAVRTLLKDVPIHEYVVTNNSSIGNLIDLVGGLTVTVPNDDLIETYPEFHSGASVTLDADNAGTFVRWRDTAVRYSNNGRMERQKAFSSAFLEKFIKQVSRDADGTWEEIENFSTNYQTSITRNQYLDLVSRIESESFSEDQYYTLAGEDSYDSALDVDLFYVDEDNLMETVVKLFYLEDN